MPKQRSLSDLYVRGSEVTIDDGEGPVTVWVQKLNPIDHSTVVRKANAARARIIALKFDKGSDDYMALMDELVGAPRELLIELLIMAERSRITPPLEAEVADEDEWKEDQYLQGLYDVWNSEMSDRFQLDAEDAEPARIYAEITRYISAVSDKVEDELSIFREGLESMSERELLDTALDHRIKAVADTAWVQEYYRSEMWLATRSGNDHKSRVFDARSEVDTLMAPVFEALSAALRELSVEPTEGKDSAGIPPSSPSSDPSASEATEPSSGPPIADA